MPKVLADNEEVVFQEGIPKDPSHIYELLMGAFAEQRRSVVKYLVDGEDALQAGEFPKTFELIEAESLSHDEITLRLSIELINQMNGLENSLSAYCVNVLSTPWSEVFKQMDAFVQKIQPFADLIDHVTPYAQSYAPPWKTKIEKIARDQAGCLSNILNSLNALIPPLYLMNLRMDCYQFLGECLSLFDKEIIPFLKEMSTSQNQESTTDA